MGAGIRARVCTENGYLHGISVQTESTMVGGRIIYSSLAAEADNPGEPSKDALILFFLEKDD